MAKKIKQVLNVQSLVELELSDIDMDLRDEFFGEGWESDDKEWPQMIGDYHYGHPVEINRIIDMLVGLRDQQGATHVSMQYHEDHIGYEIEGLRITRADESLIKEQEARDKLLAEKQEKIEKLRSEVDAIEKEIQQIREGS